jgi:hypothetical protein
MSTWRLLASAVGLLTTALLVCSCGGGGGSSGALGASDPVVTSEADSILHLDQLRAAGFRGAGVRVGVISTGVVYLGNYQSAGVLPQAIYVSQSTAGTLDEGSWMLELVHQYAPAAELGFCDGFDLDFRGCVMDLANNFHADVIVDDILSYGQFSPVGVAHDIEQLEAANERLVFVHLSGNEQSGGFWRGSFAVTQLQLAGAMASVLDFGAASGLLSDPYESVTVPPSDHLTLFVSWNDPPHAPSNHALTAYLVDDSQQVITQASGQVEPMVRLDYINPSGASQTVHLAVALDRGGPTDGLAVEVTEGYLTCNIECLPLTYGTSGLAGGIVGDFPDALVVGSTAPVLPYPLDPWSNHGPARIDFAAMPDASTPDGFSYTRVASPLMLQKPDLVAPDCVHVPFSDGVMLQTNTFCGTSAAVPGIAGAAALLQSAGFNRARVLKALRSTAVPYPGAAAWDPASGAGRADAAAAWRSGGN